MKGENLLRVSDEAVRGKEQHQHTFLERHDVWTDGGREREVTFL